MRRNYVFAPQLADRLEDRLVLSHGAAHHAALIGHHHHLGNHQATPDVAIALKGTITGISALDGSGTVSPLGSVTSSGYLTSRGAEPVRFSGSITLAGSHGTITAKLYGILAGPERPFEPVSLTYTITGGTGAYQGDSGSGYATYAPRSGGFTLTFGS
jgi:hypothetical protein